MVFTGSATFSAGGTITNYGTIINSSPSLVLPGGIVNYGTILTLPAAPTGLSATPSGTSAVLGWTAVSGASSYQVKQATAAGGPYAVIGSPTTNSFTATGLTSGTTYYFVVSAVNSVGEGANSSAASCTIGALPLPWVTADIGSVGIAGSASATNGVYTVNGSGTGVYASSDQFRMVYQNSSGDCDIRARVDSMTAPSVSAKAGVMIRESLAANSRCAGIYVTPSSGVQFIWRTSTGSMVSIATVSGLTAPRWVRMQRVGNSFRAYYSANGSTWTQFGGNKTISMAANAYLGQAVTSGTNTSLCTGVFDNVVATP
jgi:regulation of enolase protein 1 (concanavalin A-like superfamily)